MKNINTIGNEPYDADSHHPVVSSFKRISWGSVFAGVVIALSIQFALSLLGLGIGMGAIDPYSTNPAEGLGIGTAIWFGITTLISLFAGGWVAARLAGIPTRADGVLHGVLTWSLFILITFYLLTTAVGQIISGVTGAIGKTLSLAGQGIQAIAPEIGNQVQQELNQRDITLNSIRQEAEAWLKATENPELQPENIRQEARESGQEVREGVSAAASQPQQAGQSLDQIINTLFAKGGDIVEEVDREAAITALMNRTGRSRAEAQKTVDGWIQTYQQAKTEVSQAGQEVEAAARRTAEDVSSAVSKAAIYAFFGLLLGVIAAAVGGNIGRPKDALQTEL